MRYYNERRKQRMFHSRADVASGKAKSGIIKERNDLLAGSSETPALETGKSRSRGDHENGSVAQLDKVDGSRFAAPRSGPILPSAA
jgi:hypothetical protein